MCEPRPLLKLFSEMMEHTLSENDWKTPLGVEDLKSDMWQEFRELDRAEDEEEILKEAVDVANYAFLIFESLHEKNEADE